MWFKCHEQITLAEQKSVAYQNTELVGCLFCLVWQSLQFVFITILCLQKYISLGVIFIYHKSQEEISFITCTVLTKQIPFFCKFLLKNFCCTHIYVGILLCLYFDLITFSLPPPPSSPVSFVLHKGLDYLQYDFNISLE